ncbi:hypothetical protein [Streptomyces sp. NPDC004285]
MTQSAKRGVAAMLTVVTAGAVGLVTNIVTDRPAWAWWIALAALLVVGAALQYYLSRAAEPASATALGAGSVAIGGSSSAPIRTRVAGPALPDGSARPRPHGVTAAGPGAVAVGGDAEGPVETDVTGNSEENR